MVSSRSIYLDSKHGHRSFSGLVSAMRHGLLGWYGVVYHSQLSSMDRIESNSIKNYTYRGLQDPIFANYHFYMFQPFARSSRIGARIRKKKKKFHLYNVFEHLRLVGLHNDSKLHPLTCCCLDDSITSAVIIDKTGK